MSADQLRRLRVRLTVAAAGVAFVVLAVLAVIAVVTTGDRRHDALDERLARTALSADGYAYPQGSPSKLVVDRQTDGYFGPNRRPGSPVLVLDTAGRIVAGPRSALSDAAAVRIARRASDQTRLRIGAERSDEREVRIAVSPVFGDDGLIAAVVAVEPVSVLADEARSTALRAGGVALLLWVLAVLAAWLLTGRALRPAVAIARREEAFLADAAHELRTPVAVIRARAEQALREHGGEGSTGAALRAIESAAERASGTIADMLELARLDARRGSMERERLRLDLLVEQVAEDYEDPARAAGATITLDVDPDAIVEGDERLLARTVANLVENAIRYGAVGGEIEVALRREAHRAVVLVSDRGPGVPPAQRGAIFDRFHRASAVAGGSGLGLPIARLVAEAHDGSLELLPPEAGRPGARFALTLPLATT